MNANEPTIIRFVWANKRHIVVCLMMFTISIAMAIWELDNGVAEDISNLLPLQGAGNTSWNLWRTLLNFWHFTSFDDLDRGISLNRVGRKPR